MEIREICVCMLRREEACFCSERYNVILLRAGPKPRPHIRAAKKIKTRAKSFSLLLKDRVKKMERGGIVGVKWIVVKDKYRPLCSVATAQIVAPPDAIVCN